VKPVRPDAVSPANPDKVKWLTRAPLLADADARIWFEQNNVALAASGLPELSNAVTRFKIPEDAGKRVYLVSQRMRTFIGEPNYLVLFNDWAVWPSGQRMHIFERLRLSYGEKRPLTQSPGQLFEEGESDDAISFVTLAVLFLWDCYVVTPKCTKFLFFSHDEFGLTNESI
jgi:hypothetical protein